jgi:hypothetical protein
MYFTWIYLRGHKILALTCDGFVEFLLGSPLKFWTTITTLVLESPIRVSLAQYIISRCGNLQSLSLDVRFYAKEIKSLIPKIPTSLQHLKLYKPSHETGKERIVSALENGCSFEEMLENHGEPPLDYFTVDLISHISNQVHFLTSLDISEICIEDSTVHILLDLFPSLVEFCIKTTENKLSIETVLKIISRTEPAMKYFYHEKFMFNDTDKCLKLHVCVENILNLVTLFARFDGFSIDLEIDTERFFNPFTNKIENAAQIWNMCVETYFYNVIQLSLTSAFASARSDLFDLLATYCPNLKYFELHMFLNHSICNNSIAFFIKHCVKLEHIHIRQLCDAPTALLNAITKESLPNFESFNAGEMNNYIYPTRNMPYVIPELQSFKNRMPHIDVFYRTVDIFGISVVVHLTAL